MRTIGIRHRVKRTAEGEARPTMIAIKDDDGTVTVHELEDEQAELDFAYKMYPIEWRPVESGEGLTNFCARHCKWRTIKKTEDPSAFLPQHVRELPDGKRQVCTQVPTVFQGLQPADRVAMVMGGSGDRLAAALSRRGEDMDATVYRIPPFTLKDLRGDAGKEDDHLAFIRLLEEHKDAFYPLARRDRDLIRVKEAFQLRQDALKARMACGQRLDQRLIGQRFLSEDGLYPEGRIEDACDAQRASDAIYQACLTAEDGYDKDLERAVRATAEWQEIFENFDGCGPRIVAGLLAAIGAVRRFEAQPDYTGAETDEEQRRRRRKALSKSMAKLKAFCGVHVLAGGKHRDVSGGPTGKSFPRKRGGAVANWNPLARQSLYLLGDQFNRRPYSTWGLKLLRYKAALRARHPEPVYMEVRESGRVRTVQRYYDGHIHRMAIWRTLTRFVEWLYKELARVAQGPRPRPVEALR